MSSRCPLHPLRLTDTGWQAEGRKNRNRPLRCCRNPESGMRMLGFPFIVMSSVEEDVRTLCCTPSSPRRPSPGALEHQQARVCRRALASTGNPVSKEEEED